MSYLITRGNLWRRFKMVRLGFWKSGVKIMPHFRTLVYPKHFNKVHCYIVMAFTLESKQIALPYKISISWWHHVGLIWYVPRYRSNMILYHVFTWAFIFTIHQISMVSIMWWSNPYYTVAVSKCVNRCWMIYTIVCYHIHTIGVQVIPRGEDKSCLHH